MILIIILKILFLNIQTTKTEIDICWDRVKTEVIAEEVVGDKTTWYEPTHSGWYEVQNRFTHQCLKGDKK